MCFHHIWLTTCLSPWTIFTFATLMSFLFFSKSHKKIPYFFCGLEIGFFGKGVVGFSLSFMIYFTKKKAEDKENNKENNKEDFKQICKKLCTICNMYNV